MMTELTRGMLRVAACAVALATATAAPMDAQTKLLRFVQEKEFTPLGANQPQTVDVRIIAATNRDLAVEAAAGRFREDLYYRLNVVTLTTPSLRDRPDDILPLATHFLEKFSIQYEKGVRRFSADAERLIMERSWPGNVRELKNVVERCVYRHDEDTPVEEIIFDPFASPYRLSETVAEPEGQESANGAGPEDSREVGSAPKKGAGSASFPLDLKEQVQSFEVDLIEQALVESKHNQRKAAELLQVTYHQLRGYMKKYDLFDSE